MVRPVRRTVLICGEGKSEEALFLHMRQIYTCGRPDSPRVTVKKSGGKGSNHVIYTLLGQAARAQFDKLVACLDMDLPPDAEASREATRTRIIRIEMRPCLEAFLLEILGHVAAETSAACKQRLRQVDQRAPFEPGFFDDHFPRNVLDARRHAVPALDALLQVFDA